MEAPAEFLFWEKKDEPWVRALRAGMRAVLGFDPQPPEDVVRTIAVMYYDADPIAERFVDEVYLRDGVDAGRAMLDQALAEGVDSVPDAPGSLRALFADIEEPPTWVDLDEVELGARVFRRYGTSVFRFAGAITLAAYAENSVAKPLVLTGAYSGSSTRHRFLETASFWIDVSEPGGLAPGAPGREAALRVRIMHVFVRRRLLAHPEWDLEAWGVPISQADALLTLMGGSAAPGLAMKAMGFRPTTREIQAMMAFWRYVGHLMGVRPRWFPADLKEATQLGFVTIVKGAARSGEDGRRLTHSYLEAFAPREDAGWRERLEHGVHMGYTRFFLPPWLYAHFGMPGVGLWALHPLLQAPLVFTAETLRRRVGALDELRDRIARRQRRAWLERHLEGSARFRPATKMTR